MVAHCFRMRFAVEVAAAVREVWPKERPVFFRLSAVDGKGGSWTLADSISLAATLREVGIDMIDVSSGGITGSGNMPMVPRIPAYQARFASRIRHQANIGTIAVGGITTPQQAEDILRSGKADMIAMARELLWNADWPAHAAQSLGLDDPFSYLPTGYAHRLRQRESQKQMNINQDAALIEKNFNFFSTPANQIVVHNALMISAKFFLNWHLYADHSGAAILINASTITTLFSQITSGLISASII